MLEPLVPSTNCANFMLPYPEEIVKKAGTTGLVMSIRKLYELLAKENDDKHPDWAAFLRSVAGCYHDTYPNGDVIIRDSQTNIVVEFDDWDELTDAQKIHRGNVNAAKAAVDRIRYELENVEYDYESVDDVTRVRRALAAISV